MSTWSYLWREHYWVSWVPDQVVQTTSDRQDLGGEEGHWSDLSHTPIWEWDLLNFSMCWVFFLKRILFYANSKASRIWRNKITHEANCLYLSDRDHFSHLRLLGLPSRRGLLAFFSSIDPLWWEATINVSHRVRRRKNNLESLPSPQLQSESVYPGQDRKIVMRVLVASSLSWGPSSAGRGLRKRITPVPLLVRRPHEKTTLRTG